MSSAGHISDPGKAARADLGIPVVPVFDGYRALAILGVVLLHLLGESGVVQDGSGNLLHRVTWGTVGQAITVLFVVSGFVVFLPTVSRAGEFGRVIPYAIRRAARLLPAYWLVMAIVLVLVLTVNGSPDPPSVFSVGIHLLGLHTLASFTVGGVNSGFGVDPPIWTLTAEITFYVILPFIAAIYFRRPWVGLVVAALITVLWNDGFEHIDDVTSAIGVELSGVEQLRLAIGSTLQFPSWAFSFGLGMTGASVYYKLRARPVDRRIGRQIAVVQILALAAFVFFAYLAGGYSDDAPTYLVAQTARFSPTVSIGYSAALATLMVAIALGSTRWRRPFANRPIRKLGDISYGIYLSHMVFAFYLGTLISMPRDGSVRALAIWIAAVVPGSVLYGYLSARFVEQPVRRWARRFGRRETT